MRYSILRRIYEENTDGCAAIGEYGGIKYFAIKGLAIDDHKNDYANQVRKICGEEMEFVGADYAYSFVNPNMIVDAYPPTHSSLFSRLKKEKYARITIPTIKPIKYQLGAYDPLLNRYWTCAEKKLFCFNSDISNVYITRKPCYYCLPAINNCYYLDVDDRVIRKLKKDHVYYYTYTFISKF